MKKNVNELKIKKFKKPTHTLVVVVAIVLV
jgi:hypothetical protein